MKNTLMIMALSLASMSAFANPKVDNNKELRKAAIESCKAEGKVKKELKACVKERIAHPSTSSTVK